MRVHYLQHVPFETPAAILDWAETRGAEVTKTLLFEDPTLPGPKGADLIVVMGGPMGVSDTDKYPWMDKELAFIKEAISQKRPILGICLGAQFLAHSLGAKVLPNLYKEIGFYPVSLTPPAWDSPIFSGIPATFDAFHWHGDTFWIPEGAWHMASSEGCHNQAFVWKDRVLALQFHIEATRHGVEELVKNCGQELLEDSPYIQKPEVLLEKAEAFDFSAMHEILFRMLDNFMERAAATEGGT